jgi:hypothetical protein
VKIEAEGMRREAEVFGYWMLAAISIGFCAVDGMTVRVKGRTLRCHSVNERFGRFFLKKAVPK